MSNAHDMMSTAVVAKLLCCFAQAELMEHKPVDSADSVYGLRGDEV